MGYLAQKEVYIWLHDIRCVSYYDLFKIAAKKYGIKIAGVVPRLPMLGKVFHNARIYSPKDLVNVENVLIFASGIKGKVRAINEVTHILDKKRRI